MSVLGSTVDTWATVGVAVGTIGTVVYALFRDVVATPRRRPRLELHFDPSGNDRIIVETDEGREAAFVRFRVSNRAGKDTADDVVVLVTELRRLAHAEQPTIAVPIGLPLTWSGTSPPLTVVSVHPGSERHVDVLHVDLPARDGGDMPVRLDLSPSPSGNRDLLGSGSYEISLEIRARNADARGYVVSVSWDGTWSGREAMWEHLSVEPPANA